MAKTSHACSSVYPVLPQKWFYGTSFVGVINFFLETSLSIFHYFCTFGEATSLIYWNTSSYGIFFPYCIAMFLWETPEKMSKMATLCLCLCIYVRDVLFSIHKWWCNGGGNWRLLIASLLILPVVKNSHICVRNDNSGSLRLGLKRLYSDLDQVTEPLAADLRKYHFDLLPNDHAQVYRTDRVCILVGDFCKRSIGRIMPNKKKGNRTGNCAFFSAF